MAISFRIVEHTVRPRARLVEILLDNTVVGAIYPDPERNGILITSAHFSEKDIPEGFDGEVIEDKGEGRFPPIPSLRIVFKPRKFIIFGKRIRYLE